MAKEGPDLACAAEIPRRFALGRGQSPRCPEIPAKQAGVEFAFITGQSRRQTLYAKKTVSTIRSAEIRELLKRCCRDSLHPLDAVVIL